MHVLIIFLAVALVALTGFAVYASAAIGSGVYLKALCRGRTAEKVVALTFDDGPHPEQTPKVLEVLARENIKAAFFCTGMHAERYPGLVREIISQGHIAGNHTWSHSPHFPLSDRSKIRRELIRCNDALERAAGVKPVWFRPPYGVTNPNVGAAVRSLGYAAMGWSIRSFDTRMRPHERTVGRIVRKLHPGGIILLHDPLPASDLLLEKVIAGIKSRGYRFERPDLLQ